MIFSLRPGGKKRGLGLVSKKTIDKWREGAYNPVEIQKERTVVWVTSA